MKLTDILEENDELHASIIDSTNSYDFTVPFIKSIKKPSDIIKVKLFIQAAHMANAYPTPKLGPLKHLMLNRSKVVTEPVFVAAVLQDPRIAAIIHWVEWKFPEWELTSTEQELVDALRKNTDYKLPKSCITLALTNPNFIKDSTNYTKFIKTQFRDNMVLMNKWLRYGKNMREMG
jgi:hypothetical protein